LEEAVDLSYDRLLMMMGGPLARSGRLRKISPSLGRLNMYTEMKVQESRKVVAVTV
jgi:hypothetical protein